MPPSAPEGYAAQRRSNSPELIWPSG